MIEIKNVSKSYVKGKKSVDNLNLEIKDGEIFGFLGPNGAGKSTTIRHLMGFSKPDKGSTKIEGYETFDKYYEILNHVGYIPGEIALPAGLTGWDFIRMMQDLQKIYNGERLKELLELFELEDNVLKEDTKRMSLGVKRKLAIVVAFMSDPEVLILDEPTSGLDPVMQENFVEFIHQEKKRGKTILLSSHIFSEVDSTCDRIAIIKDGKIISEFLASDLKHASRKFYSLDFNSETGKAKFIKEYVNIPSIILYNEKELNVYISTEDEDLNKLIALLSECDVKEFSNKRESLEEYFMKFYKEDKDFGGAL